MRRAHFDETKESDDLPTYCRLGRVLLAGLCYAMDSGEDIGCNAMIRGRLQEKAVCSVLDSTALSSG